MRPRLTLDVTELSDVLADQDCFQATTRWTANPSSLDLRNGRTHTELLDAERNRCHLAGLTTFVENENSLRVRNFYGVDILGRPDLLGLTSTTAVVIDCKSGLPRRSHFF